MNTCSDFEKFKIFNNIRIFMFERIKRILTKYGDPYDGNHIIHGGNIMLNFANKFIVNDIVDKIIAQKSSNCNDLLSILFSDDYDIQIKDGLGGAHVLIDKIKNFDDVPVEIWFGYVKYLICFYKQLDPEEYDISFMSKLLAISKIDIKSVNSLSFILKSKHDPMQNGFMFNLADIAEIPEAYFKERDYNTINNYITYENPDILKQLTSGQYVSKVHKRWLRMLFIINILWTGYFDFNYVFSDHLTNLRMVTNLYDILRNQLMHIRTYLEKNNNFFIFDTKDTKECKLFINDLKSFDKLFHDLLNSNNVENKTNIDNRFDIILNTLKTPLIRRDSIYLKNTDLVHYIDNANYGNHPNSENSELVTYRKTTNMILDQQLIKILKDYRKEIEDIDRIHGDIIKHYTGIEYAEMNDLIIKGIYGEEKEDIATSDIAKGINDLVEIIRKLSSTYNHKIFNQIPFAEKYFYVYRYEWYINTGNLGGYYNIKPNDVIITSTINSCGFVKGTILGMKYVLLRIKLTEKSLFAIAASYSDNPSEKEVILPPGAILKIDNINENYIDGKKYILVIDTECIGNLDYANIEEFVNVYKTQYLQIGKKIIDPIQYKFDVSQLTKPISTNIQSSNIEPLGTMILNTPTFVKINDLNADIDKNINTYSEFPDFNTDIAYVGEYSIGNKKPFCINTEQGLEKIFHIREYNLENNLNVMSLNIHNFVRICDPRGRSIVKFINELNKIIQKSKTNVICFQEVVPHYETKPTTRNDIIKGNFNLLITEMTKLGFSHNMITNTMWNIDEQKNDYYILANCIFSKYPLFDKQSFGLTGNRAVQIAHVNYNNSDIIIANTHLEYNKTKKYSLSNATVLQLQIEQLTNIIKGIAEKYPVIITGDFNNDIAKEKIFSPLLDLCNYVSPKNAKLTGFNNESVIDHILITKNSSIFIKCDMNAVIPSDISDHYPIFASFSMIGENIVKELQGLEKETFIEKYYEIAFDKLSKIAYNKINICDSSNKNIMNCNIVTGSEWKLYNTLPFYIKTDSSNYKNKFNELIVKIKLNNK